MPKGAAGDGAAGEGAAHVIAETMYQHDPGVMQYVPLRVEIYESESGTAVFSIDRPSPALASFDTPDITKVGASLDLKLGDLLTVLDVEPPPHER
jgi:hypothetical protein